MHLLLGIDGHLTPIEEIPEGLAYAVPPRPSAASHRERAPRGALRASVPEPAAPRAWPFPHSLPARKRSRRGPMRCMRATIRSTEPADALTEAPFTPAAPAG